MIRYLHNRGRKMKQYRLTNIQWEGAEGLPRELMRQAQMPEPHTDEELKNMFQISLGEEFGCHVTNLLVEELGVPADREPVPLSDREYVESAGQTCPKCFSYQISYHGAFETEGPEGWQNVECESCGATWKDLFRLVGYEGQNITQPEGKPESEPKHYLLIVSGCVEPQPLEGPFTEEERDARAREARNADEDDGVFWVEIDENGVPEIGAFSGAFMEEQDDTST
jgi:DNA-directed RNA polymerase subunit M/transcription elongation factor TFIIS